MKAIYYAAIAAGLVVPGTANAAPRAAPAAIAAPARTAAPLVLSAAELDRVTAGLGANNVAEEPWFAALIDLGFSLNHNLNSDVGADHSDAIIGVAVPGVVPNSICLAFCS